jgi:hypothetical protein
VKNMKTTTYEDLLNNDEQAAQEANKPLELAYVEFAAVMISFITIGLALSALVLLAIKA